jgi:endonuclease YncB( thermonuclease family)
MVRLHWLAFIALVMAACSTAPPLSEEQTTLRCPDCQATPVLRVIDGDTFDTPSGRVRLFGVDTPERGEPCFKESTSRLRSLAGKQVRIEPGPRAQDRGGRLLLYAYTEAGNSIDETLIREGLAVAWTRDGQHRDLIVALAREARNSGTGCLW